MKLAYLLFLIINSFHLLLSLLGELLELFLHSGDFIGSFLIFIIAQCFFLCLPYLLERIFFFFKGFKLSLEVLKLIFLLYNLIDIVFAIQIPAQFGDFCFVLLYPQFLLLQLLFEFNDTLVVFSLSSLLFLLAFFFLLDYFVHFAG